MQDAYLVFALITVVAVAMVTNKVRYDFLALLVIMVLSLSGVLTVSEAFAGFGHPVVVLVACLLVIGEMLDKTGIATSVGDSIARLGGQSDTRLLCLLMLSAAFLSCIMSSTAVVAIFIPIIISISERTNVSHSRLLLPVAYAALISGMITLIATPPNLVINDLLLEMDSEGLGFFEFAPLGLLLLLCCIFIFAVFGRFLLPVSESTQATKDKHKSFSQLWEEFSLQESIHLLRVKPDCSLIGQTLEQSKINSRYNVRVLAIVSSSGVKRKVKSATPEADFKAGDILVVTSTKEALEELIVKHQLIEQQQSQQQTFNWLKEIGAAVVLVHPNASIVNKTVVECGFRTQFKAQVMAIKRSGELVHSILDSKLQGGDMLFVVGPWKQLKRINNASKDLLFLEHPKELQQYRPKRHKGPIAIAIVVCMVALKLFHIVPIAIAAMMAVVAAIMTRCISAKEAYQSISWSSVVLIAGMLPLAAALEKSGGTNIIVDGLLSILQTASPHILLLVLFSLTTVFTLVLSNTTSAVLMTPIALGVAATLNLSPYPLAIAILMGASSAFASPVSTSVVTIIVEPGNYKFSDFLKAGLPVTILSGFLTVTLTPLLFPF